MSMRTTTDQICKDPSDNGMRVGIETASVTVALSGHDVALATDAGPRDFEFSICHEAGYASAVVIAEVEHLSDQRNDPIPIT
jgi:phosphopantetheinyl transferase (holo-ACP synthase)